MKKKYKKKHNIRLAFRQKSHTLSDFLPQSGLLAVLYDQSNFCSTVNKKDLHFSSCIVLVLWKQMQTTGQRSNNFRVTDCNACLIMKVHESCELSKHPFGCISNHDLFTLFDSIPFECIMKAAQKNTHKHAQK